VFGLMFYWYAGLHVTVGCRSSEDFPYYVWISAGHRGGQDGPSFLWCTAVILTPNFSLFPNSDTTRSCLLSAPCHLQALTSRLSVSPGAQTEHKIKEKLQKHKSNVICFVESEVGPPSGNWTPSSALASHRPVHRLSWLFMGRVEGLIDSTNNTQATKLKPTQTKPKSTQTTVVYLALIPTCTWTTV